MKPARAVSVAAIILMALASIPVLSGGSDTAPPTRDVLEAPPVRLLIVTSGDLEDSMAPLAAWKNKIGIPSEIVLLPDAIASGEGVDDAGRLFDYISSRYSRSGGNLSYIILGGDSDIIPVRYMHAGAASFGLDDEYLSDVYFAAPGTDWDPDGDRLYGESGEIDPNMTFPLAVGRIPASTPVEMANYISKVITYESNPPDGDWTETMVMASSLMDRPNVTDDPGTPQDEGYDPIDDNGRTAMERLKAILPYHIDLIEVQDHPQYWGMNYSKTNDTLIYGALPSLISSGAAAVTFAGQSFYDADVWDPPTAYSLAQWFDPSGVANGSMGFQPALSSEDVPDLTNGGMLPVAYFSSCDSANFSDPTDSDLSGIILAESGGAICMIGSTGVSWRGEYSEGGYGNWYLLPRFWEEFYGSDLPGRSLYDVKEAYLHSYYEHTGFAERVLANLYGYNYIGDPTLRAWTAPPRTLDVTFDPMAVHAGGEPVSVTVTTGSGSPVSGALVSAFMEGSPPFVGSSGPDGKVTIDTIFPSAGTASITVSARGYLPVSKDLTVLAQPPDLSIVEGSLRISPDRPTAGSPLSITVSVQNEGGAIGATPIIGLFDIAPPEGTWPEPIVEVDVPLSGNTPAFVHFNVSHPQRTWKTLTVAIRAVTGEIDMADNVLTFPISINAPPLVLGGRINLTEDGDAYEDLNAFVFDPDTAYSGISFILGAGTPEWIELVSDHFVRITPPADWSGDVSVPLRVSDGQEHAEGDITVSVQPVNDPPLLRGITGNVTAYADVPKIIELDPYDAEGGYLNIRLISTIEGLTVSGYALRLVPEADMVGDHLIVLNVSDPDGAFTIVEFTLSVLPARKDLYFSEPSVHMPDATVGERYEHMFMIGGDLALNATFSDNTTLFDIDPITGVVSFVPGMEDAGEHWVRITLTSGNQSASRSFVLSVSEKVAPPEWLVWALSLLAAALLLLAVALYLWQGRKVQQYGEE
jgi:hypothetical protein